MFHARSVRDVARTYFAEFLLVLDLIVHARRDKRNGWG